MKSIERDRCRIKGHHPLLFLFLTRAIKKVYNETITVENNLQ